MYDTTNIYQLYSIINLLSLHIQTVISQKQSASTIPVRPSRVAAPWQLFTMLLARSVACFNEEMNVMLQAWNHPCWLFEGNVSYLFLSCCVLNILLLDSLWWRSWNGYCTVHSEHWSTKSSARLDAGGRTCLTNLQRRCFSSLAKHPFKFISPFYKLRLFMLTVFTLSIPLSYFDYFGHVHPSLSKGWHLILGLCGRLRCEIQPMQNNSLESLHGLLPWFCWTQLRCKLYQIVLYLHMLYILGNNCQPKKNDCTNHKGGLMVRKFHEINKINVIIVCQYVTSNTLNFHQMECVPKCQTAHSCAQPCAHQNTHFW